ncbi:hypothetical protein D3C75_1319380 [compost metagenome]
MLIRARYCILIGTMMMIMMILIVMTSRMIGMTTVGMINEPQKGDSLSRDAFFVFKQVCRDYGLTGVP